MRTLQIALIGALVLMGAGSTAHADEADVHFAAHFGLSYAITMIGYGIAEKGFEMKPVPAFIFAAGLSLLVGFTYKYMEAVQNNGSCPSMGRAMLQNTAGVGAAGLSIAAFKF